MRPHCEPLFFGSNSRTVAEMAGLDVRPPQDMEVS